MDNLCTHFNTSNKVAPLEAALKEVIARKNETISHHQNAHIDTQKATIQDLHAKLHFAESRALQAAGDLAGRGLIGAWPLLSPLVGKYPEGGWDVCEGCEGQVERR
jgi:hypothetical protein